MNPAQTIVDILRIHASRNPDRLIYQFLKDGEIISSTLTCGEILQKATAVADQLHFHGINRGERALLVYPSGPEFVISLLGCMAAGVIAVPASAPRPRRHDERLERIVRDAEVSAILTSETLVDDLQTRMVDSWRDGAAPRLITPNQQESPSPSTSMPNLGSGDIAFLQYTSGSTGKPKGVMVSHGNILNNLSYIETAFQLVPSETVSVTWLPSFHDMGLIDGLLEPLYLSCPGIIMPPAAFLQKPVRWLQAISNFRGTHSGGPNFAYQLCARINENQRETLDLSSWTTAYSGAEPVRELTIRQFSEVFRPQGFQKRYFYPCYGLAENTLMVSGGMADTPPVALQFHTQSLLRGQAQLAHSGEEPSTTLVSSGKVWLDTDLRIVNPKNCRECTPGEIGEVWVKGSSAGQGYWQDSARTDETFKAQLEKLNGCLDGPFLRTGDLGFLWDGELFVAGRLKDVIIIKGHNHYPQDIEASVEECHPSLRPAACAAFSAQDGNDEKLVLAVEVERTALRSFDEKSVFAAIRRVVSENHDLSVSAICLLRPGSIPKTSSGKIQRHRCLQAFLSNQLRSVASWCRSNITPENQLVRLSDHEFFLQPSIKS
ncbi:MAG: fatty acyl-AMP ligase [Verrucomicrobiales bacterium]|jgi:acyl-CoA synthetase (AMP-forming)/AMP-acid ligase II|nr:fatty acyl-AMP ligase [Verrucomicrobiales bacterium]MDF1786815.1 fatty acyl-AMP ligase [Verrucomicrobiales bacterium]